jgi:uncharacterized protein (TIGR02118 family)
MGHNMPKMIFIYDEPTDRRRFDKAHEKVFAWTKSTPGVVGASYRKVVEAQNAGTYAPYLVVEIDYESMEHIQRAFELAKDPEALEDAKILRTYLPRSRTVLVTE